MGEAHGLGVLQGQVREGQGKTCPYPFDASDLRMAWFDGFAAGRIRARAANVPLPSGVSPRRIWLQ